MGSDDIVEVSFFNTKGRYAGGLRISFKSQPFVVLPYCGHKAYFPSNLPSTSDKIWRITQARNSGDIGLTVYCNNVEVVNVVMSDKTCSDERWSGYYSRDRDRIKFDKTDTASDYYRAG